MQVHFSVLFYKCIIYDLKAVKSMDLNIIVFALKNENAQHVSMDVLYIYISKKVSGKFVTFIDLYSKQINCTFCENKCALSGL